MVNSIGWHVMQVDMYYWKICGSGDNVYHENICYGRTCPEVGISYRSVRKLQPMKLL